MTLTMNTVDPKTKKNASMLVKVGITSMVLGVAVFGVTYYPVISEELKFMSSGKGKDVEVVLRASAAENDVPQATNPAQLAQFDTGTPDKPTEKPTKGAARQIVPINADFSIVIPKINANRPVVANVDPYNRAEYHTKLKEGVAHAKGTAFPGEQGNMFIFSHSSVNFYEAPRYNTVFYLLDKMSNGDKIYVAYKGKLYTYEVTEKKVVKPADVSYLEVKSDLSTLTLMTCTPVGTSVNRLVVNAKLVSEAI